MYCHTLGEGGGMGRLADEHESHESRQCGQPETTAPEPGSDLLSLGCYSKTDTTTYVEECAEGRGR